MALGCVLGVASNMTFATEVGGTVKGRVTQESGAAIAGAKITLTHKEKNITRTTQANADGEYVLRNLPVGEYSATIGESGYNTTKQEDLAVLVGSPVVLNVALQIGTSLEEIVVTGVSLSRVDMAASTAGMTFDAARLDLMPVDNGFEEAVLLTPGTVETGSDGFRGASSIGGASSAENGYYLNGINVTQIQSGLGSFGLPWEAIEQTNVQTGGITAEFGGALGGVVNSVTKTGNNEFKYGMSYRVDPRAGSDRFASVRSRSNPGQYWLNNERDENSFNEANVWLSGPILKDRLFFYGIYNPLKEQFQGAGDTRNSDGGTFTATERTSDRWLANLEWYVTDKHSVRLTGFNTKRERTDRNYVYDETNNSVGAFNGLTTFEDGGQFWGGSYHGEITNNLALDVVYGNTKEEEIPRPQNTNPLVEDCRTGSCFAYSNHSDASISPQEFVREQLRADLSLDLADHAIKAGIDTYEIDVDVDTRQNGAISGSPRDVDPSAAFGWWQTRVAGAGDSQALAAGVTPGAQYVRRRVRLRFSDSTVSSKAFYLQDNWQVSDNWSLDLGVRYTSFENTVSSGEVYADLDGNIEPRVAAVWDVQGDGRTKAYASAGRYFQPVAARMNIVQGASSIEYFDFYATAGLDAQGRPLLRSDGSPERGAAYGPRSYRQRGITDPNLIASRNLEAMYSDQISLGFETEVFETLRAGVRVTYSELGRSVEDTDYGPVLTAKLAELGIDDALDQSSFYILSNPGKDVQVAFDFDQDGDIDPVTLTAAETRLPEPERKYAAVQFTLGGELTDKISFDASYTWSHSYGNTEGLVKTDNDQADPGWTTSYDYGDLMDHSAGDLPNDRRHAIKLAGLYNFTQNWIGGVVMRATSGAPKSRFGIHPAGVDSCAAGNPWEACVSQSYDYASHYDADGNVVPRGSVGRLPWITNMDLSMTYRNENLFGGDLVIKATVYNALNEDDPIAINQEDTRPSGTPDDYGLTNIYPGRRFVSLEGRYEF